MNKKIIVAALMATGLFAAGTASAGTATSTLPVSATVNGSCVFNSVESMAFGSYIPLGGNKAATANIDLTCSNLLPFEIAVNAGSTAGASVAQRLMTNGANTLQYNLYFLQDYSIIWEFASATGTGTNHSLHFYGLLPDNATNQAAPTGTYTDTVTVTLTY